MSQGFIWDREATTILIMAYESYPSLYKTNDPNYKLKNKRQSNLNNIKSILSDSGYDVETDEINRKIHNLRTQFFKEYAKHKNSLTSGSGTEEIYQPKLWCYEILKFLINTDPVRPSKSSLDKIEDREGQAESPGTSGIQKSNNIQNESNVQVEVECSIEELRDGVYLPQIESPPPRPKKFKKLKASVEKEELQLISNASSALTNITNKKPNVEDDHKQDAMELFGSMIGQELRKIDDPDEVRQAKREILNAVLDAQERAAQKKRN